MDMRVHIANVEKEYNVKILKDECSVAVWTGSHIAGNTSHAAKAMEFDLLEQYNAINGKYPIGNPRIFKTQPSIVMASQHSILFN